MRTVFDIANATYDEWVFFAVPLTLGLIALYGRYLGKQRRWSKALIAFTIATFLLFLIPLWDFHNMKSVVAEGRTKTVSGTISGAWTREQREARSKGDIGYRYRTWEAFRVGGVDFGYWRGFQSSGASFTNRDKPPVEIRDGTPARVTYYEQGDDKRILKLELGEAPLGDAAATAAASAAVAGFAADWTRFATAAATGDEATVRAMTRFPFLFEGQPLAADRFGSIWAGLFTPAVRECIGNAQPRIEDSRWTIFCAPYIFYFDEAPDGWRFAEFTADPEG